MNKLTKFGFGLIVVGVLPYAIMQIWVDTQQSTYQPLKTPISLHIGQYQSPEFSIRASTSYQVLIEFNRSIAFQRMECLLGLEGWDRDKVCSDVQEIDDIGWTIWSGRNAIAKGSSRDHDAGQYSDTISKVLGGFEAQKGKQYKVVLDVRRDASELDKTEPRLEVQTFPGYWEGTFILLQLMFYAAILFGGAGLLLLSINAFKRLYRYVLQ